jgi:hypothetical protein
VTATAKPGDKGPERRSSKHAGRNASEARADSDSTDVDADAACIWGKPSRRWESESTKARLLSTGAVGAACVQRAVRNMGDLAARGVRPNTHGSKGRGVLQESEGPIVPVKRVTAVEGRGPGSECFARSGRAGDWREPIPEVGKLAELRGKLYSKAKTEPTFRFHACTTRSIGGTS